MLKDSQPGYTLPYPNALSIAATIEVDKILAFVDKNISGFYPYYNSIKDSSRENRISDFLVHHFQLCKEEQSGGFFPYDFRKNPTQQHSGKETDIGVFVLTRAKPIPIIEFEAKRFSASSNNKEYVCGERGGIERFKRGQHSSHLSICGMFTYIQSNTNAHWIQKVNSWIEELSTNNDDTSIDWTSKDEKLVSLNTFPKIEQLQSEHTRKQSSNTIRIRHYFIELY